MLSGSVERGKNTHTDHQIQGELCILLGCARDACLSLMGSVRGGRGRGWVAAMASGWVFMRYRKMASRKLQSLEGQWRFKQVTASSENEFCYSQIKRKGVGEMVGISLLVNHLTCLLWFFLNHV